MRFNIFSFEIFIDDGRFESLHHFFVIAPVGSEAADVTIHASEGYSTEDLYLFDK